MTVRVLVVGGGFSGTAVSINLLRFAQALTGIELTVVERGCDLGKGAAYGTLRREHLLNVPAGNMSCFADKPDHLVQWLAQHAEQVGLSEKERRPASFIPRQVYSTYLKSTLETSLGETACNFKMVEDEAVSASISGASPLNVKLASGKTLEADKLVLCLGNEPSSWPFPIEDSSELQSKLVPRPWSFDPADIPRDSSVLVVGTGLTMADVITSLSQNHHEGSITAVSRRGILPKSHKPGLKPLSLQFAEKSRTANELFVEVIEKTARHTSLGGDWREAVDGLRPWTIPLWRSLGTEDKREFVSKGKTAWDVHRHRIAPEIHAILQRQLDEGRLNVLGARVEGLKVDDSGSSVKASLRIDPSKPAEERRFDYVVNCTGPNLSVTKSKNALLQQLMRDGLALPGSSGMGIQVSDSGHLVSSTGECPSVWVVGPQLLDRDFESIAVPELRQQAQSTAKSVLGI